MKLNKVNEFARYQIIVDKFKRKACLSNDYIYQEAADLITHDKLYEYCGENNAFLFVAKEGCYRLYYYLNDLAENCNFDVDENLVVEIIFRGNLGTPRDKLFNNSFDHYSGDYIANEVHESLYTGGAILIAKDLHGIFLGALHQTVERGVAWISHVAVVDNYRGHGVGQALLDTFIEQNANPDPDIKPKSRYMLWVQTQNAVAVGMYQKKGFKYMNKSTISMIKISE